MSVYSNNIVDYTQMLITEAYFGKTDTLLEIEKQIGIIRANVKKYTDINRSEEVLKLNRLFEKQFGMEIFSLHIEQNNTINAYTVPVATNFDIAFNEILAKKVKATQKDGYYFESGNNLCIICNIYLGLLNCKEITDAEILAVILHELGHNFADAIYKDIEVANKERARLMVQLMTFDVIFTLGLGLIPTLIAYNKNTNKYKKKQESKTRKRAIHGFLQGVKASCSDFTSYVSEVFNRLGFSPKRFNRMKDVAKKNKVDEKARKSIGRQNEVIADKFAAIYGYGPEQASVLLKMEKQVSKAEKFIDKIPGIGKSVNQAYNDAFRDIYLFDCHPQVIQRLNEELKTLKQELEKSNLDPKLVAAMKKQVKQLEKLRDEVTNTMKNMPEDEKTRAEFYAEINKLDPDAVDKELEDRITRAFDGLLEDE